MESSINFNELTIGYKAPKGKGAKSVFPSMTASLRPADLTVLLGRNGVGKSTLLRTLVGLHPPLGGRLEVAGQAMQRHTAAERAALLSFVSTERIAVPNLRVFDLVALGRHAHTNWLDGLTAMDVNEVNQALRLTGIEHLSQKSVHHLSDGELQRVMVARTLAQNTPIIILDEPTAFLDLPNKFELMLLLRTLAHRKGKSILLSTHDLHIAMGLADKLWIMSAEGLHEGAPEDAAHQGKLNALLGGLRTAFDYGMEQTDSQPRKAVQLLCEDEDLAFWIRKALLRVGYRAVEPGTPAYARLRAAKGEGGLRLHYSDDGQDLDFGSIYELSRHLRLEP